MGTAFDLVWRDTGAADFEHAFNAIERFTFAGVEGFSEQKLDGLVALVLTHDLMHANVTRYVAFLNDASDDFIGECAPLAESVAGNMLRAMAFAWHLVAAPGLYEQAGGVIGRFMPACLDIVDEKRIPRSTDDLTAAQLGVCVRWLHSVSRHRSCALLAERGCGKPGALRTRVRQSALQVTLARAWSRRVVDPVAADARRLNEFIARLDLYRALCDRTEREAKETSQLRRCEALYERLEHLARYMPVRHAYRYASAERRLARSDPTRAIDALLHDRMAARLSAAQSDSDTACVVIASLNAAVAKQDRGAIDRCVQELRATPAALIEHKSLLTVEAAVVAAVAVPPLAGHFRREIRLVPRYRERIERVPVIHDMASTLLDGDNAAPARPGKSHFVVSPHANDSGGEELGVAVGRMIERHFGDEAGVFFQRTWSVLSPFKRSRLRVRLLRQLMRGLPAPLCDRLCQKGPHRGRDAFKAEHKDRTVELTVNVAKILDLLGGREGKGRAGELFYVVTNCRVESGDFAMLGFVCAKCRAIQYAVGRAARPGVCPGCGSGSVDGQRHEIRSEVLRCPSERRPVLDFVRPPASDTKVPAIPCGCLLCNGEKMLVASS